MAFFANNDINRLAVHTTLHQLGFGIAGVFISAFLLRAGLPPSEVFLALAGVLTLRFVLRPLVLVTATVIGGRRTLILGTILSAGQYPILATVHGVGPELLLWVAAAAVGDMFYWTCYHAFFAALGDVEHRGSQLGARQALSTLAGILGPAAGGAMLAAFGAWTAFGAAAIVTIASTIPLRVVAEPRILRIAPPKAYHAARSGVLLFASDGWIVICSFVAWDMSAFRALASRYESFGGMLAAAALAGAAGGLILGRFIDAGHIRRAVWMNAACLVTTVILKAGCGDHPILVVIAATISAVLGGLYIPSLMTAVYNMAKSSPCPLRFHFAAEGGWDCGGTAACVTAAAIGAVGAPLPATILLALPCILLQALLLDRTRMPAIAAIYVAADAGYSPQNYKRSTEK